MNGSGGSPRIGHGFDLHRLRPRPGGGIAVGGVRIAADHEVIAHSDGDVAIHALCDALLGAIAAGDIGQHFPDSDPRYAGVDSRRLLAEVAALLAARGYRVGNVDITVLAETPRLAPHRDAMRAALASVLGTAADRVSVKATTLEGLGAIGAREAIAAHAVAVVVPLAGGDGSTRP